MTNGTRAMSPTSQQGTDTDEIRRAVSPPNGRAISKPPNGVINPPYSTSAKGKAPMRPRREGDELFGSEDGADSAAESIIRDRAISPDQARSKSPTNVPNIESVARSMSPQGGEAYAAGSQPVNMASITLNRNGLAARSPSPVIDRSKPPVDGFYPPGRASPTIVNGIGGHHSRPGSTGNVTADLIRDLKMRESDLDAMRRRDVWMRAALRSAAKAGFVYNDLEAEGSEDGQPSPSGDEPDQKSLASMIMQLKQDRAKIQVCAVSFCLEEPLEFMSLSGFSSCSRSGRVRKMHGDGPASWRRCARGSVLPRKTSSV